MTRVTFPIKNLTDYVAKRGGIDNILDDNGVGDWTDRDAIRGRYNRVLSDAAPKVPFAPSVSLKRADATAIEVLGTHPANVWPTWFEDAPDSPEPDYDVVEDELLLGRFDSRAEFWTYVEDLVSKELNRNDRPNFLAHLTPEAREYFSSLPVAFGHKVTNLGSRRPQLAMGGKCVNEHEIKSERDLYSNGPGRGVTCRACRTKSAADQRAKKRAEREQKAKGGEDKAA